MSCQGQHDPRDYDSGKPLVLTAQAMIMTRRRRRYCSSHRHDAKTNTRKIMETAAPEPQTQNCADFTVPGGELIKPSQGKLACASHAKRPKLTKA